MAINNSLSLAIVLCRGYNRDMSIPQWQKILPVLISISVIIFIAVMQRYSKLVAAVTATMPLTIPLSLWIVYSAAQGDRTAVTQFTGSLLMGIFPTLAFVFALWLGARAGLKLAPMIVLGYLTWAAVLGLVVALRRLLGLT